MLSVIIPTFNRSNYLGMALSSILSQDFCVKNFEILIVDNASTDETKKNTLDAIAVYSSHQIHYIYEPEPGLLSGRHRGALEATGEILVFVDDDIEAGAKWLQAINESFEDPTVQLVGGRNLPKYEVEPPQWLEWFWSDHPYGKICSHLSLLDFGDQVREVDANYVLGLNFAIRKSTLFELGGFHPDCIPKYLQHFQGDGETGLTRKANERGFKAIYQPDALLYHYVPRQRMTHDYFEKRYFYQGVCDSYTNIRESKMALLKSENLIDKIQVFTRFLKKKLSIFIKQTQISANHLEERNALYHRFQKAYQQGYQFHQNAVRQCPELKDWVMKSDYWNYKLPQLKINND
jgi:glucosyl-dolichyl phosphate glucuronosyltransferase